MKRDSILLIWVRGLGLGVFGNVLGGIMTVSLAPFLAEWFIPYIAILFTAFIYASLLFTAGLKDGQKEAKLLRSHRVESTPKVRWIYLGLGIGGVMCVPCAALLGVALGAFTMTGEILLGSYFVIGAFAPTLFMIDTQNMPVFYPMILMALYLVLSAVSAQIGYKFGIDEKSFRDFMYEKEK